MSTVNKERVWLLCQALRSGRFNQGHGTLEYTDTHNISYNCCLGVGCRIAMEHGLDLHSMHSRVIRVPEGTFPRTAFNSEVDYLPGVVAEWYGFDRVFGNPIIRIENPHYKPHDPDSSIPKYIDTAAARANDDLNRDFLEIARGFERMYLGRPDEATDDEWTYLSD